MENLSKPSSDDFTTKPVLLTVGAFHGISSILSPKMKKSEKKSKKIDLFIFRPLLAPILTPILAPNSDLQFWPSLVLFCPTINLFLISHLRPQNDLF